MSQTLLTFFSNKALKAIKNDIEYFTEKKHIQPLLRIYETRVEN